MRFGRADIEILTILAVCKAHTAPEFPVIKRVNLCVVLKAAVLVAAIAESGRIIYAVPPIGNNRILPPARVGILYAAKLNIAAVIEPDDISALGF